MANKRRPSNDTNISIDQILAAPVPIITAQTSFTPSGSWVSNTTYTGVWWREGRWMFIDYLLTLSGAPTATSLTVNMPTGFTIDQSKLMSPTSNIVGSGEGISGGGILFHGIPITSSTILFAYQSTTGGALSNVNQAAPVTFGAGNTLQLRVRVPIVGWTETQTIKQALGL
jgi:hypothetical protein